MEEGDDRLAAWLRLSLLPGLGSKRLLALYRHFAQPQQIIAQPQLLPAKAAEQLQASLHHPQHPINRQIEANLAWHHASSQHNLICIDDAIYPELLTHIHDPPLLLWLHGNVELLSKRQLAVVGARRCSASALSVCQQICQQLSLNGICITSGAALGVDQQAHRAALEQTGGTIAVLATGINGVYPSQHRALLQQIAQSGLLVSEFALDTRATKYHFPRRNRIISGLAAATLIVEAALKSGSLITARCALEQNREVMALPASPVNQNAQGNNRLIQQGAALVLDAQDILQLLAWTPSEGAQTSFLPLSEELDAELPKKTALNTQQQQILSLLSDVPLAIEIIAQSCELSISDCQQQLFSLQLAGEVQRSFGGFSRCV